MMRRIRGKKKGKEPPRLTVQSLGPYTFAIPDAAAGSPWWRRRNSTSSSSSSSSSTASSDLNVVQDVVQWIARALFAVILPIGMILFFAVWTLACVVTRWLYPPWYHYLLGHWFLPPVFTLLERRLRNQRTLLLQHVKGRVLDVGAGSGHYLRRLLKKSSVTHVVALEPLESLRKGCLEPLLQEKTSSSSSYSSDETNDRVLQDFQITIRGETLEEYARLHQATRQARFDWILLGNVLCEVANVQEALEAVDTLLAPGGFVYFSEHVASPEGTWMRTCQHLMVPWWKVISGGCHCNRDSLLALQGMAASAGSWQVVSWQFDKVRVGGGPMVMGLCRKEVEVNA